MKNIRFIAMIALMMGGMSMKAQEYHPIVEDGKQWNVLFSYPWSPPELPHRYTDIYKIEGDTLLDGVSYKVMYTTRNEDLTDWSICGVIRETENKQVFYRGNGSADERMLYDFSMQVGDTIFMYEEYMVVIETGEVLVGDEPRQQIVLEYPFGGTETWIEGMGSLYGIIDSGSQFLVGGSTDLLCYYEDGDLIWQNSSLSLNSCYFVYSGGGGQSGLMVTPTVLTFDEPAVPQTFTISNQLDNNVTITNIYVQPDDSIVLVSHTDLPQTLQSGESMDVEVELNGIGNKGYNTYHIYVLTSEGAKVVVVRVNENAWVDYVPLVHEGNDRQKWNVVYMASMNYPNDYFTEIQSIRDNITLDGVDYKLVWKEDVYDSKRIAGAVREDDKRVYFRRYWQQSYQEEVLLYDFNLSVGDTVSVGWSDYQLIVLEESQVQVNGTTRRQLGLAMYFADGTIGEIEEYWIEGVGSTYGFLNSGYEGWVGAFVHLLCYHENGNLIWDNEEFDDCVMNSDGAPASFAPQEAEWYFNLPSFMGSPITYYHMEVLGDTVVQGHLCSVISRQFLGGNGNEQYVYEDNGKVFWYNQTLGRFTTLYDFDAEVGESWTCEIDSCAYEVTVTELTYYEGWGHNHQFRAQRVSYDGELGYYGGGTIIEGIGEISGLFPYPYACVGDIYDGPYPDWLRCYLVDGEMVLHLGAYDCDEQGYCWDGTVAESYGGGDGTEEHPYLIYTSEQLALLAQQTNDGTGGDAYYKLMENINLASCDGGIRQWVSIGTPEHPFTGHFDGWGKNILNLNQTINNGNVQPVGGLFGCTNGAEISNVNLVQCYIHGRAQYVGTLVGYAGLTNISNCSIYDGWSNTSIERGAAGGLVGFAGYTYGEQGMSDQTFSIVNCVVREAVKVEGSLYAGGVVGLVGDLYNRVPYVIDGCVMQGVADGFAVQGSVAGGIVGYMWYGTIVRCANSQKVIGEAVGGMAGTVNYSSIMECINNETGQISNIENARNGIVGGILGGIRCSEESIIRDCQNHADVSGTILCGGIVGWYFMNHAATPCLIQNCYNYSRVTCHHPENVTGRVSVGGIVAHVGQAFGNLCIVECGNFGDVVMESEEQGDAGGILGSREEGDVYIVNVFNRGSVTAPIYAGGILGGGENIGNCVIQNVYNTGEVITGQEIKGAIAYNRQETDHFSDCYWLGVLDNHTGVSHGEPLQHSCAFWPTTYYGEWSLDSLQFGRDLVQALNAGAEALVEQYPAVLTLVHRWEYDVDNINDGYPVFSGVEVGYPFVGTEWYYEIQNENGSITYQHLEYSGDTTVNNKDVVIIIRTNTLYDKDEHSEVTREYLYEEDGMVYWWNKDLEEFTPLYDFGAVAGDEWEIKVGMEGITMHVDTVEYQEYEGCLYKMLVVSDDQGLFGGTIVCGIGHLTSFFPERLMAQGKKYRVEGIRCYWREGELVFKYGDKDCDEVYEEWHNGIEDPSTGSGAMVVYPNPTNGVLNISMRLPQCDSPTDQTYRITNMMGQTLLQGRITDETLQIDVTGLAEGMYFVSVGGETRKFVVR